MALTKKQLITIGKLVISFGLIYFLVRKIDIEQILFHLSKIKPIYLFIAVLIFVLSKVIASYRLNLYFHCNQIKLTQISNLKLYILGMFYNLFLPGGIGGDAYKAWLLNTKYKVKTKKLISGLLVDRLSGMLLLYVLAAFITILISTQIFEQFRIFIIISIPLATFCFWLLNKYLFTAGFNVIWKSIFYSSLVQLSQLISVIFILKALHIESTILLYLFIFLISSIVSILPISIGGIGLREATFFYAAKYFGLDENISISISMLFFIIQAFVSFFGIYYHFKSPKLEIEN